MRAWHTASGLVLIFIVGCAVSSSRSANTAATAVAGTHAEASFRDCDGCPEMVVIPAGNVIVGSPVSEPGHVDDEGPQRLVRIGRLAVGKYAVTRGQWAAFVSATNRPTRGGCSWSLLPGSKKGEPHPAASWRNLGFHQDDTHPVVCVTFADAQDYVRWLSERTGQHYRLLTEAEWEYAARAGTITPYPWRSTASHEFANYGAEICCGTGVAEGRDRWIQTSPVDAFPPNAFGLHDMHGNVLQWVQDCYAGSYAGLPADGSADELERKLDLPGELAILNGTSSCSYRVVRGGNWGDPPALIRSAARNFAPPPGATLADYASTGLGVRVARVLK